MRRDINITNKEGGELGQQVTAGSLAILKLLKLL